MKHYLFSNLIYSRITMERKLITSFQDGTPLPTPMTPSFYKTGCGCATSEGLAKSYDRDWASGISSVQRRFDGSPENSPFLLCRVTHLGPFTFLVAFYLRWSLCLPQFPVPFHLSPNITYCSSNFISQITSSFSCFNAVLLLL